MKEVVDSNVNGYIIFDDSVLDKRYSEEIEIVRRQYSGMDSKELAQYIEATNSISKPWVLVQLRLKKLQERRATLTNDVYTKELEDIYQDLMNLGEWWRGIEDEVF